jgi:uncharacterized membrane protein YoaK (UPF0700 family)
MAVPPPIRTRWCVGALLTLTAVTGLIDAVSYLRLGHVFVANMTGNVVFLGFALLPGSGLSPLASVIAVAGFVVGAAVGGGAARRLELRPRHWLCTALGGQAGVLALVTMLVATGVLRGLAVTAPLAFCFGLQNATVRRMGAADLTTTVLTQTLTGLAADSVLGGLAGARPHRRLGSVACMLAGAAVGALLLRVNVPVVIGLAAVLVAGVVLIFARGPAPDTSRVAEIDAAG